VGPPSVKTCPSAVSAIKSALMDASGVIRPRANISIGSIGTSDMKNLRTTELASVITEGAVAVGPICVTL